MDAGLVAGLCNSRRKEWDSAAELLAGARCFFSVTGARSREERASRSSGSLCESGERNFDE